MGTVRNIVNFVVPTTGSLIAAYPTPRAGTYAVCIACAIVVATTLTILAQWTDETGAQSFSPLDGDTTFAAGTYTLAPVPIRAASGTMITVSATAGTANAVKVSVGLKALD